MPKTYFHKTFLLLGFLFLCTEAFSQLGSSCSNPEVVTLPFAVTGRSTCPSGNNFNNKSACGNTYMNASEYVFSFTPTSALNNCINISVNGSTNSKGVFVVEGCPSSASSVCIAQALDVSGNVNLKNISLTVGKQYFIVVSSQWTCFTFNISINTGVCSNAIPPSNCENSTIIPSLPYNYPGFTTCGAGKDYNQGNQPQSIYMSGEDYVFSYTPSANECISVTLLNTLKYTGVFVYSGCPNDPKTFCMAYNINYNGNPSIPYIALAAGKTYYILVSTYETNQPCTAFDIDVENVSCGGPGSSCVNPFIVPSLPYTNNTLTTCGAKADYTNSMLCNGSNAGDEDFVLKYSCTADVCVEVTLSGTGANSYAGLYALDACPNDPGASCLAKSEVSWSGKPPSVSVTMKAGKDYYFVIAKPWSCASFGITFTPRALNQPGTSCTNPYNVPSLPFSKTGLSTACFGNEYTSANACGSVYMDGEDFVFAYNSPGNETIGVRLSNTSSNRVGVFVTNKAPDAPGAVCVASKTSTAGNPLICTINLTTPGTYYIIVDTDPVGWSWAPGSTFTKFDIDITNLPPGVTCQNPYVIPALPFVKSGMTTQCYGKDYTPAMACGSPYMNGEDFVFRYDAIGQDCINIKLSNLNSNVGLFLLDGCPNAPGTNCIAQTNCTWGCWGGLVLNGSIPAAGSYYIVVSTNGWSTTNFDINMTSTLTAKPKADFKANMVDPCAGQQVTFSDLSSPCATSWKWTFSGGVPATSTSCCPVVTYNTSGRYDVTLEACNSFGCDIKTKSLYIYVK